MPNVATEIDPAPVPEVDPTLTWWQQPLYLDIENPRTYIELVAPDPIWPPSDGEAENGGDGGNGDGDGDGDGGERKPQIWTEPTWVWSMINLRWNRRQDPSGEEPAPGP